MKDPHLQRSFAGLCRFSKILEDPQLKILWGFPICILTAFISRSSPKVSYVDETALEKESEELNDEDRELLSVYHRTFDDDKVTTGVECILIIIIIIIVIMVIINLSQDIGLYYYIIIPIQPNNNYNNNE